MPTLSIFDELFILVWLLGGLVVLVFGVLVILCSIFVCYKIIVAIRDKRTVQQKTAQGETRAGALLLAREVQQANHRIRVQLHQPSIPAARYI